jgi:hypothetical protein
VLNVLRRSHLIPWVEMLLARLDEQADRRWRRWFGDRGSERPARCPWDRTLVVLLWIVVGVLVLRGAASARLDPGARG